MSKKEESIGGRCSRGIFVAYLTPVGMSYLGNSGAVLAALKGLQDKVRFLEVSLTYDGSSNKGLGLGSDIKAREKSEP